MDNLPVEIVKYIISFMNGQEYLKIQRVNKYYCAILSEKETDKKYRHAYKEKIQSLYNYIVINDVIYYSAKTIRSYGRNEPVYGYIFCNDCSAAIKTKNIVKHLRGCQKDNPFLCQHCGVPKIYDQNCPFKPSKCNYC